MKLEIPKKAKKLLTVTARFTIYQEGDGLGLLSECDPAVLSIIGFMSTMRHIDGFSSYLEAKGSNVDNPYPSVKPAVEAMTNSAMQVFIRDIDEIKEACSDLAGKYNLEYSE